MRLVSEHYLLIKHAHMALAFTSGALFALRGAAHLKGAAPGWQAVASRLSHGVDTALLAAALTLVAVLRLNPFATPWLATKLAVLVAYIVLGSLALKRARSRAGRVLAFAGALLCFASIVAIARARDPAAPLRLLGL